MNIELRNIQIHDRLSEETTAFTASLYINGKKAGWAKNTGQGGSTDYGADDHKIWPLIKEAEQYCLGLAPLHYPGIHEGGEPFSIPMNLENFIDDIVDKYWQEKENKRFRDKIQRDMLTALLIGNDKQYRKITWPIQGTRRYWTIANLLGMDNGRKAIKTTVAEYKRLMSPSERILNTNIPEELL